MIYRLVSTHGYCNPLLYVLPMVRVGVMSVLATDNIFPKASETSAKMPKRLHAVLYCAPLSNVFFLGLAQQTFLLFSLRYLLPPFLYLERYPFLSSILLLLSHVHTYAFPGVPSVSYRPPLSVHICLLVCCLLLSTSLYSLPGLSIFPALLPPRCCSCACISCYFSGFCRSPLGVSMMF